MNLHSIEVTSSSNAYNGKPTREFADGADLPPPVETRPRCANCNKSRRPLILGGLRDGKGGWTPLVWDGRYHGYGSFCTLRCCEQFANAAVTAGFSRVR